MGQKVNPIGLRLGIVRGWEEAGTLIGTAAKISPVKSSKMTKLESI